MQTADLDGNGTAEAICNANSRIYRVYPRTGSIMAECARAVRSRVRGRTV